MARFKYKFRWWHTIVALVLAFLTLTYPVDWALRYLSWKNLSTEELVDSANWYIRERAPRNKACLYAVTCPNGRAVLELIKDLDSYEIDVTKQIVWGRRFKDVCPGQTANFAIQMTRDSPAFQNDHTWNQTAAWSFYLDRFKPKWGRFHGFDAFSEVDPEPCTAPYVVTGSQPPNTLAEK